MRIGMYGGSFDPIHRGHLLAARAVASARNLERVLVIPAAEPPHKPACRAPFADRVAMARLACAPYPELEVSKIEGRRKGPSYSLDTLLELERLWPAATFELLVGADMLADLPHWHRAGELLARVDVVAFAKPGFEPHSPSGIECHWVEIPRTEASSTDIRQRLRTDRDVSKLLPPEVFAYIRSHALYEG